VAEAAVRMVEAPRMNEDAGLMERFMMETEEAMRVVMPMRREEGFGMVEMAAMEAMPEAKVEVETNSPKRW
jgi:hypothetical protein